MLPCGEFELISTHAPAGGATSAAVMGKTISGKFLLTPLREGRLFRPDFSRLPPPNFYSRPCGRGDSSCTYAATFMLQFLLTPLREGRPGIRRAPGACQPVISTHAPAGGATGEGVFDVVRQVISTHAPAGGATSGSLRSAERSVLFLLTPLREGRRLTKMVGPIADTHFYSRPCGRGDRDRRPRAAARKPISTHAPAGGATLSRFASPYTVWLISTHAPAGGATVCSGRLEPTGDYFYSRPCGRGDPSCAAVIIAPRKISTHAPAGGATGVVEAFSIMRTFLLTPLREGRPHRLHCRCHRGWHFYSRPCGRGDQCARRTAAMRRTDFYSRPCGRGDVAANAAAEGVVCISTHAPAGGATAIFHKSVMRFCGKLPKDDTVLCLASFGFPRRDPKAVYLAWISCANLPQKCVRQGLALKDQGTSCFHEGLASHAFDPVLV